MDGVDYKYWANYIREIHDTLSVIGSKALEIAAGNCNIAPYLKSDFNTLIVTDISLNMLKSAYADLLKVCCDMCHLPFSNKFDFIFSTFDSINYLENEEKLNLFFHSISNILSDSGFLTFDVSLEGNSKKYVKELNREGKYQDIKYLQKSIYDENSKIHKNQVTIFYPDGKTFYEEHIQKIYDFYYYFEVLENANLSVLECFDAFTFNDASPKSERVQFIVKRNK